MKKRPPKTDDLTSEEVQILNEAERGIIRAVAIDKPIARVSLAGKLYRVLIARDEHDLKKRRRAERQAAAGGAQ